MEKKYISKEEIQSGVDSYDNWYHCIPLPFGIVTPGMDKNPGTVHRWEAICKILPPLKDKTVLDVGAWDGYYSFAAEKEGAKVLSTDHWMWSGPGWGTKQGFNFIKKVFKSQVNELDIDVSKIHESTVGTHDIVFFLNVLYHLTNPYECFQKIATTAKEYILMETLIDIEVTHQSYMRFIPKMILGDHTNWFIPNQMAVKDLFDNFGFTIVEQYESAKSENLKLNGMARMTYLAERTHWAMWEKHLKKIKIM